MVIDSFQGNLFPSATIKKNEESKSEWDLDESHGYILESSDKHFDKQVYKLLQAIAKYVYTIKEILCEERNFKKCTNEAIIFVVTPCTFQEIPPRKGFDGINKPKCIVTHPSNQKIDSLKFRKDNKYRASRRHIMLQLRQPNNPTKLRSWKELKDLLLHELSHTMCNHVTYRTKGNHENDFNKCENFLKDLVSKNIPLKMIEKQILKEFY